uniref:Uncharacterized protein n=1 Tax=Tetranychus urticae TaxID=32264 RepID=T1KBA5_TETUR
MMLSCFILISLLVHLLDGKKYGGTNVVISDSGGCGHGWSGGCGGGKGNIIITKGGKKGKGSNIIVTGGGGCCGGDSWKSHGPWKPVIVPIKVPSYHSNWPLTNWPHTSSWVHHTLGHNNHGHDHGHHHHVKHGHHLHHSHHLPHHPPHHPPHHSPHHSHAHHAPHPHIDHHSLDLLNWDKAEPVLTHLDKHDSLLSAHTWEDNHHHLHGEPEISLDHKSLWGDWIGSSSLSAAWSKKNDFGSIDDLVEDSWNQVWR